jgi:hypothetical protein
MSFYITLPSNSSTQQYANTQTNYTTLLQTALTLNVPYEVALVEFSYREYMSFDIGFLNVKFRDGTETAKEQFRSFKLYAFDNEPVEHFLDRLNVEILDYYTRISYCIRSKLIDENSFSDQSSFIKKNWKKIRQEENFNQKLYQDRLNHYSTVVPRIELKTNNHTSVIVPVGSAISFTDQAQNIFKNDSQMITSSYEMLIFSELLNFVDYLMVYCDLVEPQTVGDVTAPLLRTITKTGKFNTTNEKIFTEPHYMPVLRSYINTINVDVRDPSGQPVRFENQLSKVILKLHFRPIRYE